MALNAIVDSLDEVPEGVRGEYVEVKDEKDPLHGKFRLVVRGKNGWELENVSGLKSSLAKERDANKKYQTLVKSFGDTKPEDVLSTQERLKKVTEELEAYKSEELSVDEKAQRRIAALAAEKDAIIKQKDENAQIEIEKERKRRKSVEDGARAVLVDEFLRNKVDSVAPGYGSVLAPRLAPQVRVVFDESAGKFHREILNSDGHVMVPDSSGREANFKDLWLDFLDHNSEFAKNLPGRNKSGGGSTSGYSGGVQVKSLREAKTPEEKVAAIRARLASRGAR